MSETALKGVERELGGPPFRVEAVEMRFVRLELREPFETSFGRQDTRLLFLVSVEAEGERGWGEVVAAESPHYSYETATTARHVIHDFLAPALIASPVSGLDEVAERFAPFRGHPMAKAGIELAFVDLLARRRGAALADLIGSDRESIPVGVSLGIQPRIEDLLDRVDLYLSLGYQRIKLKIKLGWDLDVVAAVRQRHPDILLSVDANSAYTADDFAHLKRLDEFGLLMIEQPLHYDDLVDHSRLQAEIRTPICLDESITSARRAAEALALKSCRMINIKVGRVGGYSEALRIHDMCLAAGVPVWCGGMLESGIGRAHNIALASLPGFTLPGDISASSRYFARDLIKPEVVVEPNGTVNVPRNTGFGFELDWPYIEERTVAVERIA